MSMALSPSLRVLSHALLLLVCLSVALPMLIVLGTSFKPAAEVFDPLPWPRHPVLENFRAILTETAFPRYFLNTVLSALPRIAGQVAIGVLAAYAFARWRFRGRDALFALVLAAMMIPHQLTMIPNYVLIARLDWFDTWAALVVPNLAAPFGVFLLRQHFLSFPRELFDAAEIDGAGPWRTLWIVVLPNLGPALAALTIVQFIETWNEYFWPLLVTGSDRSRTLQVGLRHFLEEDYTNYGALMAGVTLASLPALLVFFVLQRRVMSAFLESGLKG